MDVYWLEQTAADVPGQDDWLSAAEGARLEALRLPKRRADWRLGRWTAKCAVAASLNTLDLKLADIEICAAESGAPEAAICGRAAPVTISLTHRDAVAVCAVASGGALGCDLELIEPRSAAFIADYFTLAEQRCVAQAAEAERQLIANLLWSAKESALKAMRTGLRQATTDFAVAASPAAATAAWSPLQVQHAAGVTFHGWWRRLNRFVLTLVAAPSPSIPVHLASARALPAGAR